MEGKSKSLYHVYKCISSISNMTITVGGISPNKCGQNGHLDQLTTLPTHQHVDIVELEMRTFFQCNS